MYKNNKQYLKIMLVLKFNIWLNFWLQTRKLHTDHQNVLTLIIYTGKP